MTLTLRQVKPSDLRTYFESRSSWTLFGGKDERNAGIIKASQQIMLVPSKTDWVFVFVERNHVEEWKHSHSDILQRHSQKKHKGLTLSQSLILGSLNQAKHNTRHLNVPSKYTKARQDFTYKRSKLYQNELAVQDVQSPTEGQSSQVERQDQSEHPIQIVQSIMEGQTSQVERHGRFNEPVLNSESTHDEFLRSTTATSIERTIPDELAPPSPVEYYAGAYGRQRRESERMLFEAESGSPSTTEDPKERAIESFKEVSEPKDSITTINVVSTTSDKEENQHKLPSLVKKPLATILSSKQTSQTSLEPSSLIKHGTNMVPSLTLTNIPPTNYKKRTSLHLDETDAFDTNKKPQITREIKKPRRKRNMIKQSSNVEDIQLKTQDNEQEEEL